MKVEPLLLERFFARYEFTTRYNLAASDVEAWTMRDLLTLADDECRTLWERLALGYTESAGHPTLRKAIAETYDTLDADEVLVCVGGEEGIFLALNATLRPGDHAIVIWPSYQSLHELARATGAEVSLFELKGDEEWRADVERLRSLVRPNTRLIIVNFPHNPTGTLPDRTTFEAIIDVAREAGCWLLSDEVYRGLEFGDAERLPRATDLYERAISLDNLSKTYAMPGLRIGWLATRDRQLLARCAELKDYTTICSAGPSEVLALIALRARERVWARSRNICEKNLILLDEFFARHRQVLAWTRPRGGSIAYPRFLDGRDVDGFAERLAERYEVLILPGSRFGDRGARFRLGFGRADLAEGLEGFERGLREL